MLVGSPKASKKSAVALHVSAPALSRISFRTLMVGQVSRRKRRGEEYILLGGVEEVEGATREKESY